MANINGLTQEELKQFQDLLIKANNYQLEGLKNCAIAEYNKRRDREWQK